jgi:hypothetical protein
VVFIYQAFFVSLDALNYYTTYLRASVWMNEKIWATQENLRRYGPSVKMPSSGTFATDGRLFDWDLSYAAIDTQCGLCRIDLAFAWKQGAKVRRIARTAFARYEEK